MHVDAPDALVVPVGHVEQAILASCGAYFPASQLTHILDPEEDAVVPALHAVQEPAPAFEKYPGAQSRHSVEFSGLYFPVPHSAQLELPAVVLKEPARHGVQLVAPRIDTDPAGHATQEAAALCGI